MNEIPSQPPFYTPSQPVAVDRKGVAIAAFVIGILNLCGWILPVCGIPLAIIGGILGVLGLQSSQRTLAIVGIVLCALTLIGSIIAAIAGGVIAANPEFMNFMNQIPTP
jgi:hypothetical protein